METRQETCAQRIDEQLKSREDDLRALLDNPDSDWGQDDPALSIQKREIVKSAYRGEALPIMWKST